MRLAAAARGLSTKIGGFSAAAIARPNIFTAPPVAASKPRFNLFYTAADVVPKARAPRRARLQPFHLAVPVHSLDAARSFYGGTMSFEEGRSSATWIDYNMLGHQLVCHWAGDEYRGVDHYNKVDTDMVGTLVWEET